MLSTLKDALNSKLKSLRVNQRLAEMKVLSLWGESVGIALAKQTKAQKMINGRLYITVSSSVWAHQLAFFKNDYLDRINRRIGEPLVKDIFFQVGNIQKKEEEIKIEKPSEYPPVTLSDAEKRKIRVTVASIENDDLQESFRRLMEKDYKQKKIMKDNGWTECRNCGAYCPPNQTLCRFCQQDQGLERRRKISQWLLETPWMNYEQAQLIMKDLSQSEYDRVKEEMENELRKILAGQTAEGMPNKQRLENRDCINKALTLAMLVTGFTPDILDHHVVMDVLGKELYESVFSD